METYLWLKRWSARNLQFHRKKFWISYTNLVTCHMAQSPKALSLESLHWRKLEGLLKNDLQFTTWPTLNCIWITCFRKIRTKSIFLWMWDKTPLCIESPLWACTARQTSARNTKIYEEYQRDSQLDGFSCWHVLCKYCRQPCWRNKLSTILWRSLQLSRSNNTPTLLKSRGYHCYG